MNNKGFTMIEVVISIFVIGIIMSVVIPVLFTVKNNIKNNQNESLYIQSIYNTIAKVKEVEDWELIENEIIQIYDDEIIITYDYKGETSFDTEKILLIFKIKKFEKQYELERSIYHEL